jgi:two-component system, response regulator
MAEQAIILLADDNPSDVALTQRALQAAHLPNPVQIVATGQEVIEYLTGAIHARHSGARIPLLILLDLGLPDLTGFEVLEWIRTQQSLANVPVVIYTGSENVSDANRAMHLGANSYWVKPSSFQGLVSLMQLLKTKIGALELTPKRAMSSFDPGPRKAGPPSRPLRP